MERDQQPPHPTPEATPAPNTRRVGFLEKWNKSRNKRQRPEAPAEPEAVAPEKPESQPPRPERAGFGKKVVGLLFGERKQPKNATLLQSESDTQEQPPHTPEHTPQFNRATRMRRLARVIIADVLGQVDQEPLRARQRGEAQPLSTQPLAEAAESLQTAADTLEETITQAQTASGGAPAQPDAGGYDSQPMPETPRPLIEQAAADRIDRRLRRLEAAAEEHRAASVAVVGLGVLAVLLTGAEYFGRTRADRKIRQEIKQHNAVHTQEITRQRAEFATLRQEQVAGMDRTQRSDYYDRLSTFTTQQAKRTRGATRELQEVVIAHTSEAPVQQGEVYERRTGQRHQPEQNATVLQNQERTPDHEPKPLVRVEAADRTERQPGQQTGSAGTGFFGGGGDGIASGTGPSDLNPPLYMLDPNSPEARKLEELRKLEQARLQHNAWFYGAALIVAVGILFVAAVLVG